MHTLLITAAASTFLVTCAFAECDSTWSYDGKHGKGPAEWYVDAPACGHENQSPINIDTSTVEYDASLTPITLDSYFNHPMNHTMVLKNNGHTAVVSLSGDFLIHGIMGLEFKAAQFHFHWGSNNSIGSEHTITGKSYPMELHIVHYNTNFSTIGDAFDQPKGLAVLGFMFEIVDTANPDWHWVTNYSQEIATCGKQFELPPLKMEDMLAHDYEHYWRYQGSLTTPPCHESVIWTVFQETIKISQPQMDAFRALMETKAGEIPARMMVDTFRPVTPLNNRKVYTSTRPNPAATTPAGPVGAATRTHVSHGVFLFLCSALLMI